MSKTYKMRDGDDVRDMEIHLTENGQELSVAPASAVLKINNGGTILTRNLTGSGATWNYRWTDADFEALGAGTFLAEVYCTFEDESNATFPTSGSLSIVILPRME
jgi:hypothetical protein